MKPYLPHNILLVLAVAVTGLVILYNVALRQSYATTLQYDYPAVEQPSVSSAPEPDGERFYPADEAGAAEEDEAPLGPAAEPVEEAESLTSVRFPLDINTATVEQLKFIPQVGDVMAQRIVQYREALGGGYTDLEQLREIKGVGDKTYEHLYTYLAIVDAGGEPDADDGDG